MNRDDRLKLREESIRKSRESGNTVIRGHQAKQAVSNKPGLGTWTEKQLKKIGVTQDRYKAAKAALGMAPTCHCKRNKEVLDEWTERARKWWQGQ